jgi:hypothetical protein
MLKQNTMFAHSKRAESGDRVAYYCPQEPYIIMYDFFWNGSIADSRTSCNRFLTTAFNNEKEKNLPLLPLNLYFFHDLLRLVAGAHTLYIKEELAAMQPVVVTPAGFQKQVQQLGHTLNNSQHYPLYLTPVEWVCPRLVIKAFFTLHAAPMWEYLLHRLLQSTTGSQPILSVMPFCHTNLQEECLLLRKLIEAAWVIRVLELPAWED